MNYSADLEIHFHQPNELSLYYGSNSSGVEEQIGEVGLFTLLSLRMLSNLGSTPAAADLATLLSQAAQFMPIFAAGLGDSGFILKPYPGYKGRKQFLISFTLGDDGAILDLKGKGFGFLGRGMGYYAPTAVAATLRFLAQKRQEDVEFAACLATASELCSCAFRENRLALNNQGTLALQIIPLAIEGRLCQGLEKMIVAADERVCAKLSEFLKSVQEYNPDMELTGVRNYLYAYFCGACQYLSSELDRSLAKYKTVLIDLELSDFLLLISAFNFNQLMAEFLGKDPSHRDPNTGFFVLCGEAVCEMYDRPSVNYTALFHNADYYDDPEVGSSRLGMDTVRKIFKALGMEFNVFEVVFWARIGIGCIQNARRLLDDPAWTRATAIKFG